MGFAEEFEKNKKLFIGVAVMVLVAIVVMVMTMTGGPSRPSLKGKPKLFYTVDDGKTYFEDDADKSLGFERDGKPAYRVQVYQCGDGKPFVGYIQRVEDAARKEAETARSQRKPPKEVEAIWINKVEVKKPGDAKWLPISKGEKVMIVTCPDGKTMANIVLP